MNAQQARPIQAQIRINNGYILYFYTVHLWALHIRIKFVLMHDMEHTKSCTYCILLYDALVQGMGYHYLICS